MIIITPLNLLLAAIVFVIIEMLVWTLDFLALGIATALLWLVIKIYPITNYVILWIVYIILAIFSILIVRFYVKSKLKENVKKVLSMDELIGQTVPTQEINWKLAIYSEWVYYTILNPENISSGDVVKITAVKWNKVEVEKL